MNDDGEEVELGPNASRRLAAMPCPRCGLVGKLSIRQKTIMVSQKIGGFSLAGAQLKTSARQESLPVLDCLDCGRVAVGQWTTDGYVAFPSLERQ